MMDNILYEYTNGNVKVAILEDGTKIREYENAPLIVHPESMDIKITNYCDLGCSYCHELSTTSGKHCDVDVLIDTLVKANMPKGIELALGGGNPLAHPNIFELLKSLKTLGFICNITINQNHLERYLSDIELLINLDLVKGIGISLQDVNNLDSIKHIQTLSNNVVIHTIAGVNKVNDISVLLANLPYTKVLVLGYKEFGRGVTYYNSNKPIIYANIQEWYKYLPRYFGECIVSFDNLAIEQLNVKRYFTKEGWDKFYMGDDFTFTMYIDAVNQEYAPTSRSGERVSFKNKSLLEYFKGN